MVNAKVKLTLSLLIPCKYDIYLHSKKKNKKQIGNGHIVNQLQQQEVLGILYN